MTARGFALQHPPYGYESASENVAPCDSDPLSPEAVKILFGFFRAVVTDFNIKLILTGQPSSSQVSAPADEGAIFQ
jgi:hypothetical protein